MDWATEECQDLFGHASVPSVTFWLLGIFVLCNHSFVTSQVQRVYPTCNICGGRPLTSDYDDDALEEQAIEHFTYNFTTEYTGIRRLLYSRIERTAAVVISSLILPLLLLECYWCSIMMTPRVCVGTPSPVENLELGTWSAGGLHFIIIILTYLIALLSYVLGSLFVYFLVDAQLLYIRTLINLSSLWGREDEEKLLYDADEALGRYCDHPSQNSSWGVLQLPITPDSYEADYEIDYETDCETDYETDSDIYSETNCKTDSDIYSETDYETDSDT
ncbi:hypothetical protein ACHAPU_008517 [Fusarium lateritium]